MLQFHHPDEMLTNENVIPDGGAATPEEIAASDEVMGMIEAGSAQRASRRPGGFHPVHDGRVHRAGNRRHYRAQAGRGSNLDCESTRTTAEGIAGCRAIEEQTDRAFQIRLNNRDESKRIEGEVSMITRKEIRDLAEFQSARGCAVTFYYQPDTPPNQSHRDEAILVKDLAREALREAEKAGSQRLCARRSEPDSRLGGTSPRKCREGEGGLCRLVAELLARVRYSGMAGQERE